MSDTARAAGVKVHLDGARIFNASVASGLDVATYASIADSMMFCFSKALGAPVGSILVGDSGFIEKARKVRKMFGGGMRQIGVLCAAASVALDTGIERLAEDHANAARLAAALSDVTEVSTPQTNIVYIGVGDADAEVIAEKAFAEGVAVVAMPGNRLRAVTSYEVTAADIDTAADALRRILG